MDKVELKVLVKFIKKQIALNKRTIKVLKLAEVKQEDIEDVEKDIDMYKSVLTVLNSIV